MKAGTGSSPCLALSEEAAELGARLLELRLEERSAGRAPRSDGALAWAVHDLEVREGAAADEALAALLGYYLGEAHDEEVMNQVTLRGARMVPLLGSQRRAPLRLGKVRRATAR